ncbi:DUF2017 family protein [Microbacterium sp. 18062]|uniref:DUF2017 family protein n=1 Tax=Microbacterium sp. 18062 TaxID=2681410 RepID=UPI001357E73D|nr:DUF2017 family protein [Microbacterium sp. 18062]
MTVPPGSVVLELTRIEAVHLRGLVDQFVGLLADTTDATADPAVSRLVPSAYPDDEDAAAQFRSATQSDLLLRRTDDAAAVLADLTVAGDIGPPQEMATTDALVELTIVLDRERTGAWLRTLAAVRLVLASRLGIVSEDDHDPDDPRYGVYEWLGYRLDGLSRAASSGEV